MAAIDSQVESDNGGLVSAINITPFVDVVLVLLVIFIVTAPMLVKDVLELKLPKTQTGDGQMMQTLGVAINQSGSILLNGQIIDDESLKQAAAQALAKNSQAQAIIAADESVIYGRVVKVIDLLKQAGLNRFAVQIQREGDGASQSGK